MSTHLRSSIYCYFTVEPWHDKTNKMFLRQAKTQISLGIRPVWSESSLSAWRKLGSLATQWVHNEDSDQTGRMPRLICVFTGCTVTLLVLSCRGSVIFLIFQRNSSSSRSDVKQTVHPMKPPLVNRPQGPMTVKHMRAPLQSLSLQGVHPTNDRQSNGNQTGSWVLEILLVYQKETKEDVSVP